MKKLSLLALLLTVSVAVNSAEFARVTSVTPKVERVVVGTQTVCSQPQAQPHSSVGAIAGVIGGGLLGSRIGKGNGQIAGTIAGAGLGGFVGDKIDNAPAAQTCQNVQQLADRVVGYSFVAEYQSLQIGGYSTVPRQIGELVPVRITLE